MAKRVIAVFLAFTLIMGSLFLRIYQIQTDDYAQTATKNNSKTVTLGETRGMIYDCNLVPLVNDTIEYRAAVKPTEEALSYLRQILSEKARDAAIETLRGGSPTGILLSSELTLPADFTVLPVKRRYAQGQLACHVIGYLENGNTTGASGVEKSYQQLLSDASGKLQVSYSVDAHGRILTGDTPRIGRVQYDNPVGVSLTIDKRIQQAVEDSLSEAGFVKGSAVVLEVGTGKIRAMASLPTFQPDSLAASLQDENAPLINRALSAYAVGSIFKIVVAIAALEHGITPDFSYTCTGKVQIGNVEFNCHEHSGHGLVTMETAIAQSCNTYFISIAQQIGAQPIVELAQRMGIGTAAELAPGFFSDKGNLPENPSDMLPAALANLAFGQGELLATPLQMAEIFASVAQDGFLRQSLLVEGKVTSGGELESQTAILAPSRVMEEGTARKMRAFLAETVRAGSGMAAMPETCTAAGKTATAQSGWYVNGVEIDHSWFAGFFPVEQPKYVIVIMKENGIAGGTDCAPVFKAIADQICKVIPVS